MDLALVYIPTVVLFLVLLLSLGFQPKFMSKLTGGLLFFAGISGILLYGYGYSVQFESIPQVIARTLFSVFCMFLGRNEIGAISAAPLLKHPAMQVYIYVVHLMALYATASAMAATIGTRLIRTLRLLVLRRGDLAVIYGTDENTVGFAEQLLKNKKSTVVMVDTGSGSSFDGRILRMGSLLLSTEDAKKPTSAFLKRIGLKPGKRRFSLYCLSDASSNLRYASAMKELLEAAGVYPAQTNLTILLENEEAGAQLEASEGRYGFGSVYAVDVPHLAARLMIKTCHPASTMSFDSSGRAAEDFEALVIGFGRTGQAVLRTLIMNGQFCGSRFHATVVSDHYREQAGSFYYKYPGLENVCHVDYIQQNARSIELYDHFEKHFQHLNYVAVCTGSEKENAEIASELADFFASRNISAPIFQCSHTGIRLLDAAGIVSFTGIYSVGVLENSALDAMAKVINHRYHLSEGRTADEDWALCDYFSRMSCRASADYVDAYLTAAGTTREAVLENGWELPPETLENLSIAEHLRWMAFHQAMGYRPMPEDAFEARAAEYRRQLEATGKPGIRPGKDTVSKLHACLIPWEELDALGEREFALTGRRVDYKEMDRDNVRMVADMLRQAAEEM